MQADFADDWLLLRVRADFADGWLLLRRSVTAEQVTLRAEARTPERLRELLALAASALPEGAREALWAAFNG